MPVWSKKVSSLSYFQYSVTHLANRMNIAQLCVYCGAPRTESLQRSAVVRGLVISTEMVGMNHEHTTWVQKFNKCCDIPIAWRGRKESRASEGLSESLNPKTCTRQTAQKSGGKTHAGYRKALENYLGRWYWWASPDAELAATGNC